MMSIAKMGRASVGYYTALTQGGEAYYLDAPEPDGVWIGEGAQKLGLVGPVREAELSNLMSGHSPDGLSKLVQNAGSIHRVKGWDATNSAPKCCSAFWGIAHSPIRTVFESCHEDANAVSLEYMQGVAVVTRRGKGGAVREPAAMVVSSFTHGSSRENQPQLHTHNLILNLAVRSDGTVGSIESRAIYQHVHTCGAIYRAALAANLKNRLGLTIKASTVGFEIVGIPESLIDAFSTRRKQIEAVLALRGQYSAAASQTAALATRSKKQNVSREDLLSQWHRQGAMHNFTDREAARLIDSSPRTIDNPKHMEAVLESALAALTESQSDFRERDLLRAIAVRAPDYGLSAKAVRSIAATGLTQHEVIRLHDGPEPRYSTRGMLRIESDLLQAADRLATGFFAGCGSVAIKEASRDRSKLSDEQAAALNHVVNRGSRIRMITGWAGSGKSTVLRPARELLEQQGYHLVGTAVAARAARNLQDSTGIISQTLHSLLTEITDKPTSRHPLSDRSVIIVDEAGVIASRQMRSLLTAAANAGATVILVGDAKQLQPIAAGGPFSALCKKYGDASLHTIRRQKDEWARSAVTNMASGAPESAIQAFAERGHVTAAEGHDAALAVVIDKWKRTGVAVPKSSLLLANSQNDVSRLNSLAQQSRLDAGMLGTESVIREDGVYHKGDRVTFAKNNRILGVNNGDSGTVARISATAGILTVILDTGGVVSIDAKTPICLGYATTTAKSQGSTVKRSYVLLAGGHQDLHSAYVQVSRATDSTDLVIDTETAGEELGDLIRQLRTTHTKGLAIDNLMPAPQPLVQAGLTRRPSL